jgi:hypothetical protein
MGGQRRAPRVQFGAGDERGRLDAQLRRQPRQRTFLLVDRHVRHQRQVLDQPARLALKDVRSQY